jgi:predicted metal-binding membrane protein
MDAAPMDYASWSGRERLLVVLVLSGATALSWLYLVGLEPSPTHSHQSAGGTLLITFVMWSIMMVGMMLPSALPMVLAFSELNGRESAPTHRRLARTAAFVAAYVVVWVGYSAVASVAQFFLRAHGLGSEAIASPVLSGMVLLGAGAFQWSALKYRCLERCRTPMGFLLTEWRSGLKGSFVMGLRHGTNCLGCCWGLMALMFVVGAMNLLWMAVLSVFCLVEKAAPGGPFFGRFAGVVLVVWGALVLTGAHF